MDLIAGHVYRAKRPRNCHGLVNDRMIVWAGSGRVQFDSPSVSIGRHLPTVRAETFAKWAGQDVTGTLPEGEWLSWDVFQQNRAPQRSEGSTPQ